VEFENEFGAPLNISDILLQSTDAMTLAAEFKRASPSKGPINMKADILDYCSAYTTAGAKIISILTEPRHFKGSLDDLKKVRVALTNTYGNFNRPALLRKDFIFDRFQVLEARVNGADTILLMVSVLGVNQLKDLIYYSRLFKMEPLVEVASLDELDIALDCGARVIGVNNRNLHDFSLNSEITEKCMNRLKQSSGISVASLSGITTVDDVRNYRTMGVRCCLVGESIMKAANPISKIQELLNVHESKSTNNQVRMLTKICGVSDPKIAQTAVQCGAAFIGMIFVSNSPRKIPDYLKAQQIVSTVYAYGERKDVINWQQVLKDLKILNSRGWYEATKKKLQEITLRTPLVVGVVRNQTIEEVNNLQRKLGLDIIQLHGNEDVSYAKCLSVPVFKVVHVNSQQSVDEVRNVVGKIARDFTGVALAILLDTSTSQDQSGGTGKTFDWNVLDHMDIPVIVAGGIRSSNVQNLLTSTKDLTGIDVNSGIEKSKAVKDESLLREFFSVVDSWRGNL